MKKILSILASFSLLVAVAVSCEEKVVVDPSASTAPVLVSGSINASGASAEYTPGELNVNNAFASHTLAIVKCNGKSISQNINSTDTGTKLTATAKDISKALIYTGKAVGDTVSLEIAVRILLNPALSYGGVDSKETISTDEFVVVNATEEASVVKYYDYSYEFTESTPWTVIGSIASTGNSWDKDEAMVSNGTWCVCVGITLSASDQFKFRKDAAWGTNYGAAEGITDEPYVADLDADQPGGANGKNLGVAEDGVYDLFLNPEAGTYRITKHVDNPFTAFTDKSAWSVIGAIASTGCNWDSDIAMTTNGKWSVALDVVLAASDQFKFRKDGAWTTNFGAADGITEEPFVVTLGEAQDGGQGGKNLAVPEDGTYNLLVNEEDALYIVIKPGLVPPID